MAGLQQMANQILEIKNLIKSCIESQKGGTVSGDFSTYPDEIMALPIGRAEIPTSWQDVSYPYTAEQDGWVRVDFGNISGLIDGARAQLTLTIGQTAYTLFSWMCQFDYPRAQTPFKLSGSGRCHYPIKSGQTASIGAYNVHDVTMKFRQKRLKILLMLREVSMRFFDCMEFFHFP